LQLRSLLSRRLRSISIRSHWSDRPFDNAKRRYDDAAVTVHNTPQLGHVATVILHEHFVDDKLS